MQKFRGAEVRGGGAEVQRCICSGFAHAEVHMKPQRRCRGAEVQRCRGAVL